MAETKAKAKKKTVPVVAPAVKRVALVVQVLDGFNKPLKEAEVEVVNLPGGPKKKTDNNGRAAFGPVNPKLDLDIKIRKSGFGPPASPFTPGERRIVTKVDAKGVPIQTKITRNVALLNVEVRTPDPENKPIEGAIVGIDGATGTPAPKTKADGKISFFEVPPGVNIRTHAQKDGFGPTSAQTDLNKAVEGFRTLIDGEIATVTLRLSAVVTLEFVTDPGNSFTVNAGNPVANFVRMALWDHAFTAAPAGSPRGTKSTLNNDAAEAKNFIGADSRRFYLRVKDAGAHGRIQVAWRTLKKDGTVFHAPADQNITLLETGANTGIFGSRALILVSDRDDQFQSANSGLPAGDPAAGVRTAGQSNHRIRLAEIDGFTEAEYHPAGGGTIKTKITLFNRSAPDERRKLPLQIFILRVTPGGAGVIPTAPGSDLWNVELRQIREVYARLGIRVETVVAPGTQGLTVSAGGDSAVLIDPPAGINPLSVSSSSPLSGNTSDESKLGAAFPGLPNTIRVFYTGGLASGNRGEAWTDVDFAGLPQNGACFVNRVAPAYNAAHEIGHILINKAVAQNGAHYVAPAGAAGTRLATKQNLLRNGTSVVEGVLESKRLWNEPDADGVVQATSILISRFLHTF